MKRLFDITFSGFVLIVAAPVLLTALIAVWLYDRHSPIYRAPRVGLHGRDFHMLKIRSMRVNADKAGGSSTAATDSRITPVGRWIRRCKLDELSQFWNVLKGDMSVVGPRPQIRKGGVDRYTDAEMGLLNVRPGITDLASIIFSDEGDILAGSPDPDARYDRIIRPWKSRLGLLYAANASIVLDLRIIWLTAVAIVSKPRAHAGVGRTLQALGAEPQIIEVSQRQGPLPEAPPPGAAAKILS